MGVVVVTKIDRIGENPPGGPWWTFLQDTETFQVQIFMACAKGHRSFLSDGHTVADDGTVSPSVACTHLGCGWHKNVQLAKWSIGKRG